ncbi:protein of unknown function [Cupriavidus taiwanensis]|nr:protein of unknown function [Cupriavidus taiwanensis]
MRSGRRGHGGLSGNVGPALSAPAAIVMLHCGEVSHPRLNTLLHERA